MRATRTSAVLLMTVLAWAGIACSLDSSSTSDEDRSDAAESSADADCDPARPLDPSDAPLTFSFDGEERSYELALPDDYDGTAAQPLIFNFHGNGGSAAQHGARTQMASRGTDRGYVVVTPDALSEPQEWNMFGLADKADDFGFVDALVADLDERLCIDPDRLYAAGHSNGSAFTGFLQCKEPYRFAAVAMVAAFIPSTCDLGVATPSVLAIHGTADPGVPYDGGPVTGGPVQIPGVLETLAGYVEQYECDLTATEDEPATDVERQVYGGCLQDSEVALITIVDGVHDWPGSVEDGADPEDTEAADTDGAGQNFSATDAILDFFDTH